MLKEHLVIIKNNRNPSSSVVGYSKATGRFIFKDYVILTISAILYILIKVLIKINVTGESH